MAYVNVKWMTAIAQEMGQRNWQNADLRTALKMKQHTI